MSISAPTFSSVTGWRDALLGPADESLDEETLLAGLFCRIIQTEYNLLSVKAYRLRMPPLGTVPVTPCLSHEAQLHEHDLPHLGSYVQHRGTGRICGVVYLPMSREIVIEEENEGSEAELAELTAFVSDRYPDHEVKVQRLRRGSAFVRARDVAEAHLPLECVLCGGDEVGIRKHLDRLNGISQLMEKESRVTSWGMRTAYPPLIAAIAFVLVLAFPGSWDDVSSFTVSSVIRLLLILGVGGAFLYYGLKAVQLTKSATRLAKRIREYDFILTARKVQQGNYFESTDPDPLPGFRSAHNDTIAGLLERLEQEHKRVAWYVTNRVESTQIALGHASGARNPMLDAIVARRLDLIAAMEAQVADRLAAIGDTDISPGAVSERASLRGRKRELAVKRARFERFVNPDGDAGTPGEGREAAG